ncbi:hypothetical protein C8J57DRAFT_1505983 [Mycena rebaudengoi]|nr:hypothetical protein C8J57DRAFT_1505983 [Mycena rebaudengoi]
MVLVLPVISSLLALSELPKLLRSSAAPDHEVILRSLSSSLPQSLPLTSVVSLCWPRPTSLHVPISIFETQSVMYSPRSALAFPATMTQNDSSGEYSDTGICALIAGLNLDNEPARSAHPECTQICVSSSGPPTYSSLPLPSSAPPTYISEPLAGPHDSELTDLIIGLTTNSSPSNPSPTTPPRRTAIYTYSSPTAHGVTADWHVSLVGSASQGIPHGSVYAKPKAKKSRHAKGAYVVFHGRRPAVYLTWDEAKVSVHGSPNAIYRGYSTLERAQAAFKYAEDCGWICSSDLQSPTSAISVLPEPMLALDTPNPLHGEDIIANKWFVVYRGITPGVYQSVLEALLNTSGVRAALYEGIEGKSEAIHKYQAAVARGHRKRAELKMRSPEEQQLYAEKARTSQAKYREKHRERLAMEQGRRRMFAYGSIYGTKQMSLWVQKLAEKRERKEATRECRVRRLRCEVRAAAKTAARAPTPSDSEADESDDNRSDDEAQASE